MTTYPCVPLRAAHDSGPRRAADIRFVVLHDTEGGDAHSNAVYFARETTRASTQLVVDDEGCYRCLPDLVIPWGAPGANTRGLHVEHCGFKSWTRAQWRQHGPMLRLSAEHVAHWCWAYSIPVRYIGPRRLRFGFRGITTHAACSAAFPPNEGHSDPGPGFPLDAYLELVREARAALVASHAAAVRAEQT